MELLCIDYLLNNSSKTFKIQTEVSHFLCGYLSDYGIVAKLDKKFIFHASGLAKATLFQLAIKARREIVRIRLR